jgi:transposase
MNYIIGCDAHRHYSQFAVDEGNNLRGRKVRVEHERGAIREFLSEFPEGTPVALESIGNWYWIVEEIEQAGCQALLAHPAKAKAMMGNVNKTDKLDARGLATLLRNGTLPPSGSHRVQCGMSVSCPERGWPSARSMLL